MERSIAMVEIYERAPDCQVCGNEIEPGKEMYTRGRRVCSQCKKGLAVMDRERGKQPRSGSARSVR